MTTALSPEISAIWTILDAVCDPEIPVVTITDLGIIRDMRLLEDDVVEVVITPTYSGCPAMGIIEINIRAALQSAGYEKVKVTTVLSPSLDHGLAIGSGTGKLATFGIAPPAEASLDKQALMGERRAITCPFCQSMNTEMLSQFGSTSCKALFRCLDCREPFDYFKCH